MMRWFEGGGEVAIYDATNTTKARRALIEQRCREKNIPVVFIESICDDPAVIEANVRETKVSSPDYAGADPEQAVHDFRQRIAHYERQYEPVDDPDSSYIKIIDVGQQVVLNRIHGYVPSHLAPLLINLHVTPRPIWLTRHGESTYNQRGLLGGDPELSPRGEHYARSLAEFVKSSGHEQVTVWTSTLRRTMQTALPLGRKASSWRALDEIDGGVCDGMTYEQMRVEMPDIYQARKADKFRYRYPRGESYEDVIQRVDRVIVEIERQRQPVLVIGHQAVLRALYAYFAGKPPSECPYLPVPLHTVIQLTPTAYGCDEKRFKLDPVIAEA